MLTTNKWVGGWVVDRWMGAGPISRRVGECSDGGLGDGWRLGERTACEWWMVHQWESIDKWLHCWVAGWTNGWLAGWLDR